MLIYYVCQIIMFYIVKVNCDDYEHDYKSAGSDDQSEINEVFDLSDSSDITEQFDNVFVPINPETYERNEIDVLPSSEPTTIKSSTPSHINANTTGCGHANNSESSEEDKCRSTLVNYPFSVTIQKKGSHYASGALVNNQTVLTAAGDFFYVRESIKLYRVRLGSVDCKKGGILMPIKSIDIHPSFVLGSPAYDLAVIKLSEPVQQSEYIKPIKLSTVWRKVISAKFMTTYWPRLIVRGMLLPKDAKERIKHHSMRVSTQKLIPWKSCYTIMKTRGADLDENSLCLKPLVTHHSVCTPDVGAPVVAKDGLWGITSGWTSEHCKMHPSPTLLTRIAKKPVRKWLNMLL